MPGIFRILLPLALSLSIVQPAHAQVTAPISTQSLARNADASSALCIGVLLKLSRIEGKLNTGSPSALVAYMFYFLGKINSRNPDYDLTAGYIAATEKLNSDGDYLAKAKACLDDAAVVGDQVASILP